MVTSLIFLQALDAAWTVGIFRDPKHRVDASEISDLHRTVWIVITINLHPTVGIVITIRSSSDGSEYRWKNGSIVARSNRDRGAIEPRSCSFSGGIAPRRPNDNRQSTTTKIRARSRRDRGPIVARSRRNSCLFSKQN